MDVIRRLEPKLEQVAGIELFMQPVQDLTVEDRISRTQYQYSLDAPDKALLDQWVPRLMDKMKQMPELRDVASDQQNNGLGLDASISTAIRPAGWASRRRISTTRFTTPSASARSRPSTPRSNQFHVILEVEPQWQQNVSRARAICMCRSDRLRPTWPPPSRWRAPTPR